ncbi:hypothetical protein D3C71_1746870 [compost metagenome]
MDETLGRVEAHAAGANGANQLAQPLDADPGNADIRGHPADVQRLPGGALEAGVVARSAVAAVDEDAGG